MQHLPMTGSGLGQAVVCVDEDDEEVSVCVTEGEGEGVTAEDSTGGEEFNSVLYIVRIMSSLPNSTTLLTTNS